jgi:riboflavin kinase/FMN adenylyltransferase
MELRQGLEGLRSIPPGGVMSIGNFDGLHQGHQRILNVLRQRAGRHCPITVVTFEPHPLTVLRPGLAPPRLTPTALKRELLAASGVDVLVELPPEPQVLNLSAEQFWAILREEVRPAHLVEGNSFNFGKNRAGTIERLKEWAKDSPVQLHIVDPVSVTLLDLQVAPVSSSLIRWLIAHGRVREAAIALGRPYLLEGPVIEGFKRGRKIGVPTANLHCLDRLIPADGVYAGRCAVSGIPYPAAVSIGSLPTFAENRFQIEAHLIGFNGDLYGQTLRIELWDWLRDQQKYPDLHQLQQQLARDLEATRRIASNADTGPTVPTAAP